MILAQNWPKTAKSSWHSSFNLSHSVIRRISLVRYNKIPRNLPSNFPTPNICSQFPLFYLKLMKSSNNRKQSSARNLLTKTKILKMLLKPKNLKSNANFSMSWIKHYYIKKIIIKKNGLARNEHLIWNSFFSNLTELCVVCVRCIKFLVRSPSNFTELNVYSPAFRVLMGPIRIS